MEYSGNSSQEAFVLEMLGHKKNGFYVELGAFHSSEGSNTYELEKTYDWQGVSFELLEQRRNEFIANRTNPCMGDALNFDYIAYFENNLTIYRLILIQATTGLHAQTGTITQPFLV
jgi:hypothetical protein